MRRELQKAPKKGGDVAREMLVGMCNALRTLLPLKSLQAYAPTCTDTPTASTTRQRSERFGGMRFNADICSGDAHWVLPPELWPESAGIQRELLRHNGGDLGVVVRILVIATDEGSPILKTFFFLAGHCKLRVLFIRDHAQRGAAGGDLRLDHGVRYLVVT